MRSPQTSLPKRNVINIYEVSVNSTERPDPSASFQSPEHLLLFDDGQAHTIRVTYESETDNVCLFVATEAVQAEDHVEWQLLMCAHTELLPEILAEDGTAHVGFTGSTGLGSQTMSIHSLELCSVVGCGERSNKVASGV